MSNTENMTTRNFIQETINSLRHSAERIDGIFMQFKDGEISKDEFEEEYRDILVGLEIDNEIHFPNNGCKYSETNPNNELFRDLEI